MLPVIASRQGVLDDLLRQLEQIEPLGHPCSRHPQPPGQLGTADALGRHPVPKLDRVDHGVAIGLPDPGFVVPDNEADRDPQDGPTESSP